MSAKARHRGSTQLSVEACRAFGGSTVGAMRLVIRSVLVAFAFVLCNVPGTVGKASPLQLVPIPAPAPTVNAAKFDPLLLPSAFLSSGQSLNVATAFDAASADALATLIQQTGGVVTRRLSIIDGVAATVPNLSLAALSASAVVQHLALDRMTAGAMERTGPTTGATAVRQELGCDGR